MKQIKAVASIIIRSPLCMALGRRGGMWPQTTEALSEFWTPHRGFFFLPSTERASGNRCTQCAANPAGLLVLAAVSEL